MSGITAISTNTISNQQTGNVNNNNENNIDDKIKTEQKKLSSMVNFEKVSTETTGHKAGRIIAGILGGLLLAAGIAAATVAVTATLGVAVGVLGTVATFAGITGSSIAAGAAGAAGIGLITSSALLAPKHLQESHVSVELEEQNPAEDTVPVERANPNVKFSDNVTMYYRIMLPQFINRQTQSLEIENNLPAVGAMLVKNLVVEVFKEAKVSTEKVTEEGVAAVRNALNQSGEIFKSHSIYGKYVNVLNKQEVKNALAEFMKEALPDLKAEKDRVMINTFIQALSSDDNQEPQEQQPQNVLFG